MTEDRNTIVVKCPTCARQVPWLPEQQFKPFCSERCRLIDLGEWVMEEKRIPGEPVLEENNEQLDDFFQ